MKKYLLALLAAAMTMVGCKKADTNNELKPFDVQTPSQSCFTAIE